MSANKNHPWRKSNRTYRRKLVLKVQAMVNGGKSQTEVAKELGYTLGYISNLYNDRSIGATNDFIRKSGGL